jgi:eukaryotic-like serine/threonine-protein kinase
MTSPLDQAAWGELLPLLAAAQDIDEPAAREAWLVALPAAQQARLRELLARQAAIETDDFLARPAALPNFEPPPEPPGWQPGQRIGPWRLIEELGRGGMATVWSAERADGRYERRVALKLPRLNALPAGAALPGRMAREGRILAQLQHPQIAQMLDAGVDEGQPWLALELVSGQPITAHATRHGLATAARLRLFVQVLRAVAHAHAQLVVHRDIKPANVLVTLEGQVKLLDFGVAKLLDAPEAETADTALTQESGRAFTPQYASPEQLAGLPLSTRSDVYALGVLLYELLTGQRPYTLQRGSAAELDAALLQARPRRPSQALDPGDAATARTLRGDVDTLVLKALQHDPALRYASAEAFADDIERHLRHEPIVARPPSFRYRAGKLWARQRWPLSAAALSLLVLCSALAWALLERQGAQAQARRAEAVQAFLATTLGANDPEVAQGRSLSARDLLDRSAARIDTDFAATPDVQARLHEQTALLYSRLGDMPASLKHAEAGIRLFEAQGEAGSTPHLALLFMRHEALIDLSRWDEALAATEQALAQAERHAGPGNRWAPRLLGSRGWIALRQGRWPAALADAERATALQVALSGEASPDALHALNNEAIVAQQTGRTARAVALQLRIGELGPRTPGHHKTDLLVERSNLGIAWLNQGDVAAALAVLQESVPALRQHLGPAHDRVLMQTMSLAFALAENARFAEALLLQRENLAQAVARRQDGDEQPALQQAALARVLLLAGRPAEALPLAEAAAAAFEQRYARPTWARERARWFLAEALIGSGERERGIALLKDVRRQLQALAPLPTHPGHAQAALVLAVAQRGDDLAAARALATQACQWLQDAGEDGALRLPRCRAIAAWLDGLAAGAQPGAQQAALARFVQARDTAVATLPASHPLRAQGLAAEAELRTQGLPPGPAEAAALRREADTAYRAATGLPLPAPLLLLN